VFKEPTKPANADADRHKANQKKFEAGVKQICRRADLTLYQSTTNEARKSLWNHLWTKIKYAGIRAENASGEISDIKHIFECYECFSDPSWDIEIGKHSADDDKVVLLRGGTQVIDFLTRKGDFKDCRTNGKLSKIKMIINVARNYGRFVGSNPDVAPINFITEGRDVSDIWEIHGALISSGYRKDLTCCHLMMDVGFEMIKPDIQLTRMFLEWGWLHQAIPSLPADLIAKDLEGKGAFKSKYLYTKPSMYRPVIDLAKQIIRELDVTALEEGVGWVSSNPLREFDLFVVKAAQDPEVNLGIEKTLFPTGRVRTRASRGAACAN
jgi:hypothetical protein